MTELWIILALVLLNGVFSGAEIAVLSMRKTRLGELIEEGSGGAAAVLRLRDNPEGFLATVQIGITVVGATAAAFGGSTLAERLVPLYAAVPQLAPFAPSLALGTVVASVSVLSIVLGELVPKSLALRASEPYALFIARPLEVLAWIGRPAVATLTGLSNVVLRLFGDRTTFTEARLSREELQQIVEDAATTGSVDPNAGEIAARAIGFSAIDAYTLMVPRTAIVMLPVDATVAQVAEVARASGHARVPVYEGTPENVVGVVNLRDVLAAAALGAAGGLSTFLHRVPFVPETMTAPNLLRKLQSERSHLAVVIDESGGVVGLVTIEDLIEELVGDILSEDEEPDGGFVRDGEGAWLVQGDAMVHTTSRELGLDLPEGDFATIAGLCLHLAGQIPAQGAVLDTGTGVTLEVVEATPRRIKRVRILRV